MYFAQVTHYDILYAVNHLARASKPTKAHMGAAIHLLRYLAGSTDFSIVTYRQGGLRRAAFSYANWGNNPDNSWSTPSYIVIVANAPISFETRLQGLTAQSTMEAELVAEALTIKEAIFCSNMMLERGFDESFGSVPLSSDNTSALHVAGNPTYSPRAKHIALRYYFFVQELVEEGKFSIYYVKSEDQLADLGTKHLSKHHHRNVFKLINEFEA